MRTRWRPACSIRLEGASTGRGSGGGVGTGSGTGMGSGRGPGWGPGTGGGTGGGIYRSGVRTASDQKKSRLIPRSKALLNKIQATLRPAFEQEARISSASPVVAQLRHRRLRSRARPPRRLAVLRQRPEAAALDPGRGRADQPADNMHNGRRFRRVSPAAHGPAIRDVVCAVGTEVRSEQSRAYRWPNRSRRASDGEELQEVSLYAAHCSSGNRDRGTVRRTIDDPGQMPANDIGRCRPRGDADHDCRQHGEPNQTRCDRLYSAPPRSQMRIIALGAQRINSVRTSCHETLG